jgi:hypothetical protein
LLNVIFIVSEHLARFIKCNIGARAQKHDRMTALRDKMTQSIQNRPSVIGKLHQALAYFQRIVYLCSHNHKTLIITLPHKKEKQ